MHNDNVAGLPSQWQTAQPVYRIFAHGLDKAVPKFDPRLFIVIGHDRRNAIAGQSLQTAVTQPPGTAFHRSIHHIQQHLFMIAHNTVHQIASGFTENPQSTQDPRRLLTAIHVISHRHKHSLGVVQCVQTPEQSIEQTITAMQVANCKERDVRSDRSGKALGRRIGGFASA